MKLFATLACAVALLSPFAAGNAAELVLAEGGASAYQVALPDESATPTIERHLRETGELIQRAFAANGFEIPVVAESERDAARPAIFIGDTRFARANGVDVSGFQGWTYAHKAVGRNLIIAGRDVPAPVETGRGGQPMGTQMGTMKGAADFLRDYAGARFLYPGGDTGIEFMPTDRIAVPAGLDTVFEPRLRFNFYGRFGARGVTSLSESLYFVANNYFPNIAFEQHPHTYDRAVPVSEYRETNPEYFALFGDKRTVEFLPEDRMNHYCLSNPEVRELIYQDMLDYAERGYQMVVLGQQDGFRPCGCDNCRALYGTGDDWGEKLWLFHRELAERFKKDHPDKMVITLIYGPTRLPPKSFREFPDNLMMRMRMAGLERLEPWEGYRVPGGIFGALGLWGAYGALGYTPHLTPLSAASYAKQYCSAGLKGFYLDGFGNMFGMEGPTYYTFGRMFDDPEGLKAKDLVEEYYEAAFREALPPMRRFFEALHQGLQLHIDIPPNYVDEYGRSRGYRLTPLKRIRTIYSPDVLSDLEASLSQAEGLATSPKVKSRLALIRHELDYTKHIAVIAHLHEAYLAAPGQGSRDRLLDAIDARNAFMDTLYTERGGQRPNLVPGWPEHRLLTGVSRNGAHAPRAYRESPLTWDTEQMRHAPLPGAALVSPVEAAKARQRNRRTTLYENSFRIPAEWRNLPNRLEDPWDSWVFQVDPADRGVEEGWHETGFDDSQWLPIEVPAFWRETYVGDYLGYGWYRATFKLPEDWAGRRVRLLFGSIDGQAWIYINGALARERTEDSEGARIDELWELPFVAEIPPENLKFGDEPNVMAVRVYKARGNAGIWRPVLVQAAE